MVALLTPDACEMASMLVASMPRSANSPSAALRTFSCASILLGRTISSSNLNLRESPCTDDQQNGADHNQYCDIDHGTESRTKEHRAQKHGPHSIDSVRQRIQRGNESQNLALVGEREHGSRKKIDRQDQEIHDELK